MTVSIVGYSGHSPSKQSSALSIFESQCYWRTKCTRDSIDPLLGPHLFVLGIQPQQEKRVQAVDQRQAQVKPRAVSLTQRQQLVFPKGKLPAGSRLTCYTTQRLVVPCSRNLPRRRGLNQCICNPLASGSSRYKNSRLSISASSPIQSVSNTQLHPCIFRLGLISLLMQL